MPPLVVYPVVHAVHTALLAIALKNPAAHIAHPLMPPLTEVPPYPTLHVSHWL